MTGWWKGEATRRQAQPLHAKDWPLTQELIATGAARRTPEADASRAPIGASRHTPAQAATAPAAPRAALDAAARGLVCLGSPPMVCTTPSCCRPRDHSGLHTTESSMLQPTRTRGTRRRLATSELGALAPERALAVKHAAPPPLRSLAAAVHVSYSEDDAVHRELVRLRAFRGPVAAVDIPYESVWTAVALMGLKHDAAHRELVRLRAALGAVVPVNIPYESFWNAVALMDLKRDAAPGGVAATARAIATAGAGWRTGTLGPVRTGRRLHRRSAAARW